MNDLLQDLKKIHFINGSNQVFELNSSEKQAVFSFIGLIQNLGRRISLISELAIILGKFH